MIIKPLTHSVSGKRWAVVTAAGVHGLEMIDSEGTVFRRRRGENARAALTQIPGNVFSTVNPKSLLIATDARYWQGKLWQNSLTNLKMDGGPKVIPLKKVFADADLFSTVEALSTLEEVLSPHGVPLGSFSSMAWNMWRASLSKPVTIYGPPLRESLYGGRKESLLPGEYKSVAYWDIQAAYPNAQSLDDYSLRMRPVAPTSDISEGTGLAYAEVAIPRLDWGPLPVKIAERATCYGWGKAEDWWTWRDLRVAKEAGCDVKILASYAGFGEMDLFGEWWRRFAFLRNIGGYVGKMAKAITSTLWGQFALSDDRAEVVRWQDEWAKHPVSVPEFPREIPHRFIVHIASETTSRVREKLWREGLTTKGAIYCDTDSVICAEDAKPVGGGWNQKKDIDRVDIRGPQTYRYTCNSCGDNHPEWHYVVGGIASPEAAERVFRREYRRHAMQVSYDGISVPAMSLEKAREIVGSKG